MKLRQEKTALAKIEPVKIEASSPDTKRPDIEDEHLTAELN